MYQDTGILSRERRGVLACMVTEDEDEDEILQQDNVVQHKANKKFETN